MNGDCEIEEAEGKPADVEEGIGNEDPPVSTEDTPSGSEKRFARRGRDEPDQIPEEPIHVAGPIPKSIAVQDARDRGWELANGECEITVGRARVLVHAKLNEARQVWKLTVIRVLPDITER